MAKLTADPPGMRGTTSATPWPSTAAPLVVGAYNDGNAAPMAARPTSSVQTCRLPQPTSRPTAVALAGDHHLYEGADAQTDVHLGVGPLRGRWWWETEESRHKRRHRRFVDLDVDYDLVPGSGIVSVPSDIERGAPPKTIVVHGETKCRRCLCKRVHWYETDASFIVVLCPTIRDRSPCT